MDMSAAATAPRQPLIPETARAHPDFAAYMEHRSSCNRLMIQASRWEDWLSQRTFQKVSDDWAAHPRFKEFQQWMRDNKAGDSKRNPAAFPENFKMWLDGARW